jgi:K+-sensing histidine kinase KdpD
MAAVYGAAETLRRRGDELTPESQRRLVEMISDQASHLPRITQDVLLATELDRGGTALEREPVDVVEVARSAIEMIGPELPPTTDIEVDVAPSLAAASAVRDRLQQVLVHASSCSGWEGASRFSRSQEPERRS